MPRGRAEGARTISESFTPLLFALTVALAGWPESREPCQGLAVPPSLAVPGDQRGHSWGWRRRRELCETALPFAKAYGPPVF